MASFCSIDRPRILFLFAGPEPYYIPFLFEKERVFNEFLK